MLDEKYTRCPECQTVYRVTDEQLAARGGSVRCGQCHALFDGFAELVTPEPPEDKISSGAARVPEPSPAAAAPARSPALAGSASAETQALNAPATSATKTAETPSAGLPSLASGQRRAEEATVREPPRGPGESNARGLAVAVLGVLLLLQLGFNLREVIANAWPAARPMIVQWCKTLHCTVGTPRDIVDLEIASSELRADPAHQGLLILTATLRNRGSSAHAFPYLELTLTDPQDQAVVRRALTPAEYAGGTVDLARGMPANSEITIKLFIDASATNQAGYRLYLFYG